VKVSEYADLDAVALAALVRRVRVLPRRRPAGHAHPGRAGAAARHAALRRREPHDGELAASIFAVGPFTAAFNISGHPAISLPLAWTAAQVPVGVQVVARYGREDVLFRVASQLEQALPWADRRPPVCAG